MIKSMTAFARNQIQTRWGELNWELRSVNHRYLEIAPRLPEDLRQFEPQIRTILGERLKRGRVDCMLRLVKGDSLAGDAELDEAATRRLLKLAQDVEQLSPGLEALRVIDVLRWPGVVKVPELDREDLESEALASLHATIDELVETRTREGQRLRELLLQRLDAIEDQIGQAAALLPEVATGFRERLESRLAELREQLDPARLEQEIVLFLQKSDIQEELDRLRTHCKEVRDVLGRSEAVGRRLDFLMQELNREANTLGSKSVDARLTKIAVELKVLIEQMREQVQNIE